MASPKMREREAGRMEGGEEREEDRGGGGSDNRKEVRTGGGSRREEGVGNGSVTCACTTRNSTFEEQQSSVQYKNSTVRTKENAEKNMKGRKLLFGRKKQE